MEEKINEYLLKRLQSLEKDQKQYLEEMSKIRNKNSVEFTECKNDLTKIQEEIKKVNDEKEQINEWLNEKEESQAKLENLSKRKASLEKDQRQYLEEMSKIQNKNSVEFAECKNDLAKIEEELGKVEKEVEVLNETAKRADNSIKKWAEDHSISLEEKAQTEDKKTNMWDEINSKIQKQVENIKTNQKQEEQKTENEPQKNEAENNQPVTNTKSASKPQIENIYSNSNHYIPEKEEAKLKIERKNGKVVINGKEFKSEDLKDVKNELADTKNMGSNLKYLKQYGDMDIISAIMKYQKSKLSVGPKDEIREQAIAKETLKYIEEYADLIKNPSNKENSNVNITYNVKRKFKELFFNTEGFKEFKEQAFSAKEYADIEAGILTKLQFKLNEIIEKSRMKKLESRKNPELLNSGDEREKNEKLSLRDRIKVLSKEPEEKVGQTNLQRDNKQKDEEERE